MFRLIKILLLFLIFPGIKLNAQDNIVKAGLTGAFLGDFNVGIERKVTGKSSLHFKFGYLEPTLSPVISEEVFSPQAYNLLESHGGISTSLEYRFYVSKKQGLRGFYIAPYLHYFNQGMLFEDEIDQYQFVVDTKLSSYGIGGQLGYQWIIKEFFTIDFFFFGTGLDFHKAEITYEIEPEPAEFNYGMVTSHVDDTFRDIKFLYKNLEHEVNDDNHYSRIPFLFPGIRIGLSVGMAF